MTDYYEVKEDLNKTLMAMTVIHYKLKQDLGDKSITVTTDVIKEQIEKAMGECIDKIVEIDKEDEGEAQGDEIRANNQ